MTLSERSPSELIDHILARYHAIHRQQLPELIRLARRVEQVHDTHVQCPRDLADHLEELHQALESHMQKEESVLFPRIKRGGAARGPIAVMRFEHDEHHEALDQVMVLTRDLQAPADACTTWRALYDGLREFREDLVQHMQLENDVLFEQALVQEARHG
ncbi:hypothetical protein BTW10_03320 [Chromohalobacter japonicus]|uniref:Hemerythrin-like domain-containing protein n=1 Tax=Chromohalobacter japonicus TaxID=223900 RepID=A0A1Q8TFP8_9GAMM|nr:MULTISPECIES: hemerythrin domain-containing protein [Chromohalobacter]OLO12510.1 hypothetical protein BTW10_03320 [Chromohalobacter japonicus]